MKQLLNVRVLVAAAALGAGGSWALAASRGPSLPPIPAAAGQMAEVGIRERDIALFLERVASDRYSAGDHNRLASLYLQRARETGEYEDFRRAETAARRSVELRAQRNTGGMMLLASSLLAQHRFVEARGAAERLVAAEPEKPSYRALLAEIQMELGDYTAARATFGSLEPHAASLAVAPRLARWAELTGQTARARTLLYAARDEAARRGDLPREQVAWFYLRVGDLELRTGRLDAAERALREGLVVEPADHRLFAMLARLEASRQQWARAVEYGERAGERADLATLATLGDAWQALGDSVRAEAYWSRVEAGYAENPEPYARQWTQFRADHGRRIPETVAVLKREIEGRRDALGYDLLGWALYRAGDIPAARAAARQALRLGTQDATFYFHAGMIEHAAGDTDAARAHLQRALDINPFFHPVFAPGARATLDSLSG